MKTITTMSDEYTPSAEKLQEAYDYWVAGLGGSDGREVERFLAAHDKALREQIARDIEQHYLGPDSGRCFDGADFQRVALSDH